jgi:hypothetical protein
MQSAVGDSAPRRWGNPLARFDAWWTRVEQRLLVAIIMTEMLAILVWVLLKGLSAVGTLEHGAVTRAGISCIVLGTLAHLVLRGRVPKAVHGTVVVVVSLVGWLVVGRMWNARGVGYSSNLMGWLQNASVLMLLGGLRGFITRLTLWLALVGASLAAGAGRHISIDVLSRSIPKKAQPPVACLGWAAAALVCFVGAYGFVDNIAVTKFDARAFEPCGGKTCDTTFGSRLATVETGVREDMFALGKQLSLDVKMVGRVLLGKPYDKTLTNAEWNSWVEGGGFIERYPGKGAALLSKDPNGTHSAAVVIPGRNVRGMLVRDFDFLFPMGLVMIAIRFLLRIAQVISGHIKVDPDAAHAGDAPHQADAPALAEVSQ